MPFRGANNVHIECLDIPNPKESNLRYPRDTLTHIPLSYGYDATLQLVKGEPDALFLRFFEDFTWTHTNFCHLLYTIRRRKQFSITYLRNSHVLGDFEKIRRGTRTITLRVPHGKFLGTFTIVHRSWRLSFKQKKVFVKIFKTKEVMIPQMPPTRPLFDEGGQKWSTLTTRISRTRWATTSADTSFLSVLQPL